MQRIKSDDSVFSKRSWSPATFTTLPHISRHYTSPEDNHWHATSAVKFGEHPDLSSLFTDASFFFSFLRLKTREFPSHGNLPSFSASESQTPKPAHRTVIKLSIEDYYVSTEGEYCLLSQTAFYFLQSIVADLVKFHRRDIGARQSHQYTSSC